MNLNKFTEKAQEAVLESQNLAQSLGHQTIEPEHLLLSLIRQSDGDCAAGPAETGPKPRSVGGDFGA